MCTCIYIYICIYIYHIYTHRTNVENGLGTPRTHKQRFWACAGHAPVEVWKAAQIDGYELEYQYYDYYYYINTNTNIRMITNNNNNDNNNQYTKRTITQTKKCMRRGVRRLYLYVFVAIRLGMRWGMRRYMCCMFAHVTH